MRERVRTLLLAGGALLMFYVVVLRGEALRGEAEVARPVSTERRADGYFAAATWLRRSGITVRSLRERFGRLPSGGGHLLIVTVPAEYEVLAEELPALERWIRAGNTLLVCAALADAPRWSRAAGGTRVADLEALTGVAFESVAEREHRGEHLLAKPARMRAVAKRPHPYFDGVAELVSWSDYASGAASARVPYSRFMLALAADPGSGADSLWVRRSGDGRIIVSAYGAWLTNRAIAAGGNARFLANLVGSHVAPTGAVIFDDMHQGISTVYDSRKFYADRRLWLTLAVLLASWLAWVLGSTALRTPRRGLAAPNELGLIVASGTSFARLLAPSAAALRMFELLERRVRCRASGASQGLFEQLEADAPIEPQAIARLRGWYSAAQAGRRVPLVPLCNLIHRIDRSYR